MISPQMFPYVIVAITIFHGGVYLYATRKSRRPALRARDLGWPETRLDLQQLLAKANVHGSANIRDGVVSEPPSSNRAHPLYRVMNNAVAAFRHQSQNQSGDRLYWRDSVTGNYRLFGEMDVEMIEEAVALLEAKESS